MTQAASMLFAGSVTFLGCWFVYSSRTSRDLHIPVHDYLFGRAGVFVCGLVDLAVALAMWHQELGITAGALAWAITALISWGLIALATAMAPRAATMALVVAVVIVVVVGWKAWIS